MIQMPPNNNYFLNSNETCMLNANPEAFIQTTTSTSSTASSTNISNISNTNNNNNNNNNNFNLTNTNANLTLNNNNSNINNSTSLSYYTEINHSAVLVDQQITNSLQQTNLNLNLNFLNEESTRDLNGYIKHDEAKLATYEQQPKSICDFSSSSSSSNADDEELVFTLMDEDYIHDNLLLDIDTSYGLNNNDAANANFGVSNANIVNSTLPIASAQDISTSGAHYSNPNATLNNHVNAQIYIKQEYNHDEATNSSYSCSGSEPTTVKTEIVHVNQKNGKTVVEKHYGPIVVRPRKKPAPTLASGRKSKYIELSADESAKRETRRERNRQAAEKCKQKRTEIETKLEHDLVRLENEKRALDEQMSSLEKAKRELQHMFEQHTNKCTTRINTNNAPIQQQLQTTNLNSFSHPHQSYNNTTTYGTYAQTSYNPSNVTQQQPSSTIHQYYPSYNQSNLALNHQVHMPQQAPQSTQPHLFIPQQTSSTQPYDQHKIPWSN